MFHRVANQPFSLIISLLCLVFIASNVYSQEPDPVLLLRAVQQNQVDEVRKLIKEQRQLVNRADDRGFTPLHIAAVNPDTAILEMLIDAGAEINARTDEKKTPLYLAAEFGRLKSVEMLLDRNADILPLDQKGNTPLMAAVLNGQTETVKWMLIWMDEHGTMMDVMNLDGQTTIFPATMRGDLDMLKLLIKNEANPKIADKDGLTILHVAAVAIKPEIAEYLLQQKIFEVDIRDKSESTPLHLAASSRPPSSMQPVGTSGDKTKYELVLGDTKPQITVIKMLVDAGADVNAKDKMGLTPLHRAAYTGIPEIAEALLAAGAILPNEKGTLSPLHLAAANGHLEMTRLLLDKGMNVNIRDYDDITPLHSAAFKGHKEIVAFLLEKGADMQAKDREGKTPYDRAEAQDHKEVMEILMKAGYKAPAAAEPGSPEPAEPEKSPDASK